MEYRWSVWARDSQIPPYEDYLFHDPEYPIEAYIWWFFKKRLKDLRPWCDRIRPKSRKFPMISIWRPYLSPTYIPEELLRWNPAWCCICCGSFFLDSQGGFLYSPSLKKQCLITSEMSIRRIAVAFDEPYSTVARWITPLRQKTPEEVLNRCPISGDPELRTRAVPAFFQG